MVTPNGRGFLAKQLKRLFRKGGRYYPRSVLQYLLDVSYNHFRRTIVMKMFTKKMQVIMF